MDRLAHLNPAQRDAASTLSGPLLVLAGAGTGKTRVITHRMVELIRSGIPADRILSVTFTNKAAKEMAERTQELLGKRQKQKPMISTFHSYCVKVLRQEIEALGYPKTFTIYDRGDQESAARKALRDVKVPDSSMKPGDLLNIISRWKMHSIVAEDAADHTENDLEFLAAVAYRKYQNNLKACGAVDFDDLLMLTNRLFDEHPDALDRQQRRFDHVQIDEYQDTNGSQFDLIEALVRKHNNICVVGDDDQSIYGWRGAEVTHILNFGQYFKGAKVIRLEENYRCTDRILELANRLVKHNRGRHDKVLRANKTSVVDVRFREFDDEQVEAEYIAREIQFMINKKDVPPQDICILFRTNEQPRIFESELRRHEIRYVMMGSQSFFDKREIRDILAYLKVLENPRDENSLLRIINVPARGIGDSTVQKLLKRAVRAGCSLWDAVAAAHDEGEITGKAVQSLNRFSQTLDDFRTRLRMSPNDLPTILENLLHEIDYDSEIQKQYKNEDMQIAKTEIVDQMVDSLREYVGRTREPSLQGYLEETLLNGPDMTDDKEKMMEQQAVKLMTLHSAKGLEFPRVYMVGMEEGLLPHKRAVDEEGSAIDEERRLCYVGITRARDHLTLTRAAARKKWGKKRLSIPSRFIREMRGTDE
ncbi:MAG: UvrD-helicase domain-containing protein [Planctomycetota bacterium]|nr:UvrD-helicase domain-containing protein [Planctomycetota bacterium]